MRTAALLLVAVAALAFAGITNAQEIDRKKVDDALGRSGAVTGEVHRYGFPRSDLQVTLDDVTIRPALALGGWAAFKRVHRGAMVMRNLVPLEMEIDPVMVQLSRAEPRVKIVGIGATRCAQFTSDISANPALRRDYLAWAQGFMSAMLLSRPPGIDDRLDLTPPTFPLIKQLEFLQDHCARHPSVDFSGAVEALYQTLRSESGI